MEEIASPARATGATREEPPAAWRDLREWIALAEQRGQVHRVAAEVDPVEELSAITYMRTRDENAPALLFEKVVELGNGLRLQFAGSGGHCGPMIVFEEAGVPAAT